MKFAFFLSTWGGSPLQGGLSRGLVSLGHEVASFHNGKEHNYDFLVIFNQTAHRVDYAYPDFPAYDVPVIFVDSAEYGYTRRRKEVVKDYANAFSTGSMTHDTKSVHEQTRIKNYLEGRSFPYFLREFSKYLEYPENYHPIDYPLYHLSHCSDRPSMADYLGRLDGLFLSWGASHPWRWTITNALRTHPRSNVLVIEENGTPRMEQSTYFNRMVRARCSASFDGYGTGSFRMTEVLVRTLLLMGPLSTRVPFPLVDGETCVEYSLDVVGEECRGTNVVEKLNMVLDNPAYAFLIYENGYDFCMSHLTETETARWFVEKIEAHDWSKPTALAVC